MLQTVPHLLLSLVAGYVVTVALLLILTIALTTTRRRFVMSGGELTRGYAIMLALFWMVSSLVGVYVAEALRGTLIGWKIAVELAAILIVLLWASKGNVREGRSSGQRVVLSVMCAAGAAIGYFLRQMV